MALGHMSGKLMMKLEGIVYLLSSHSRDHFPFLEEKHNMRNRTIFYLTLARLLFREDNPTRFRSFMLPLQVIPYFESKFEKKNSIEGEREKERERNFILYLGTPLFLTTCLSGRWFLGSRILFVCLQLRRHQI